MRGTLITESDACSICSDCFQSESKPCALSHRALFFDSGGALREGLPALLLLPVRDTIFLVAFRALLVSEKARFYSYSYA